MGEYSEGGGFACRLAPGRLEVIARLLAYLQSAEALV
jgi:hypothetical protein